MKMSDIMMKIRMLYKNIQKKEIKNELTNEDNFDSEIKVPVIGVQENSLDLNSLQATIKKELGVEKISYNFDDYL